MTHPRTGFIFLHGFLGRAETRIAGKTFEYFRGLRNVAHAHDIEMTVPQMPGRTGVHARAEVAAKSIDEMQSPELVLVGVSMGGLVARVIANSFDADHRIKKILTIATPHHGSPLADLALDGDSGLPQFVVNVFKNAVHDLSVFHADKFNSQTPDRDDIDYRSWAFARDVKEMPLLLRSRAQTIYDIEGPNDGLVSVKSATWGKLVATERGDHLESIGWSPALPDAGTHRPFDQKALWHQIIESGLKRQV